MRALPILLFLLAFSEFPMAAPPPPVTPPAVRCGGGDAPNPDGKCAVTLEEAPRVAQQRMSLMREALTYFANDIPPRQGWFAVDSDGRSREWCEALINDVIEERNVVPVTTYSPPEKFAQPIFDPAFDTRRVEGEMLVGGYVTARWKREAVSLFTSPVCAALPGQSLRCAERRYNAVYVRDQAGKKACNVMFYESAYWHNWSKTASRVELAKGNNRKRSGLVDRLTN